MIIATSTTIALLCPSCGRLSWHVLSLFALNGPKKCFVCECGTPAVSIEKKKGHYWFHTDCIFCETEHVQLFTRKEMMAAAVHEIYCQESAYVTGCLGPQQEVKQHLKTHRRSLTDLALEVGSPDYFQNPDVMFRILERLYEMAETGEFYCRCGSQHLEIEIFPDQLELRCSDCGGEILVPALMPEDLEKFLQKGQLQMSRSGINPVWQKKLQKRKKHIKSHLE